MPDPALFTRSGLESLAAPGRHGVSGGAPGLTIELRRDYAVASVEARPGTVEALAERVRAAFGLALRTGPHRASAGPVAFASAGPGHWLATARGVEPRSFAAQLKRELTGVAFVTDLSDGRVILAVGGAKVREVLAKGIPLDLHPRAFALGDAAVTVAHHIGVQLWLIDDAPTFELAVHRSYAASFWHWLVEAGSEFGVQVK